MANKRLSGSKNYLYALELDTEVEGDDSTAISADGWFKVTGVADSGSELPSGVQVGDLIYLTTTVTPATGDNVKPVTRTKVGFVTDVPNSASKEKFEDTVQIDDAKSYEEGDKPEITGSLNGYFVLGDSTVDDVLGRFFTVIEDDGAGSVSVSSPSTGVLHFQLGRNETTTVGEVELTQYMPMIIDSLQADKPMQGKQTFSCNYTLVGSERPSIYKRTIA